MDLENLTALAQEECRRVIEELPPELASVVKEVPVFFESLPDEADIESGIEPDTLGLFDPGADQSPTPRIRLWLANIWDFAEEGEATFRDEVRLTLLHEIGHLVGWDEEDVDERGLG